MKKQRRKKSITIEQAIKVIKIKFHEKNKKPSASIRRLVGFDYLFGNRKHG
jgi:hypothetical protein